MTWKRIQWCLKIKFDVPFFPPVNTSANYMEFENALLHPESSPAIATVALFDNCGAMPVTLHDEWNICYNCHKATTVTKIYLRARGLKEGSTLNN